MIEGNEGREQLRRRAAGALERAEGRMLSFLKKRMEGQERVVVSRLRDKWERANPNSSSRNGHKVSLAIDLDGLMDPEDSEDEQRVRRILQEFLKQRGREAGLELSEIAEVAEAIEINLNAERVVRFLDAQVDRAIIVPDGTTAQMLRESLAEGVQANESLNDLIGRVRSVFASRQNMAATIARTEVLPGFNLATQEAWLESGVVEQNEWLSARDGAVREAHADMDGEKRPLGEPFDFGDGRPLDYPGDPSGLAGNTINCRCTLLPVVSEEAVKQARWSRFMAGAESRNGHAPANRMRAYLKVGDTR